MMGDLDGPSLPPKPADPLGRPVRWILVTGAPGFHYEGQFFEVGDEFIQYQIAAYERIKGDEYTAPVLREHTRTGERFGDVLQLGSGRLVDGRPALVAAVAFSDPEAPAKLERGEIKYFSPSFGSYTDDKGQDHKFVLRELSMVAAPHQKQFGPTHVLAHEQGVKMADATQGALLADPEVEEEIEETVEDKVKALEGRLDELTEAVNGLAELKTMLEATAAEIEAGDAPEAAEVAPELSELRSKVEGLQLERDRAIWAKDIPVGQPVVLTADLAEVLFGSWRANPAAVGEVLRSAVAAAPVPAEQVEVTVTAGPWSAALGEVGSPAPEANDAESIYGRVKSDDAVSTLAEYKKALNY